MSYFVSKHGRITPRSVSAKYGAPMGRRSNRIPDGTCRLQHVPLDSQGYDSGGAYWGIGQKIYVLLDQDGYYATTRANSRKEAWDNLKDLFNVQLKKN